MACTRTRPTAGVAGKYITLEVAPDAVIYRGALVAITQGKAVPAARTEEQPAIGVAYAVTDGYVTVRRGAHLWDNDPTNPITAAHIGSSCYVADDCTVTALATGSSVAGKVLGFESDQVVVETL